jgi:ABC-type Zn2+ transport system substrate-binding protein/surface adhesin
VRINNPILTILTCLVLSAVLILTNHLWDTQVATANGISSTIVQEGRFNPIQEEEDDEHEDDEHEDDEHEDDEHEDDEHEDDEHEDEDEGHRENEHGEIEATLGQLEVIRQLAEIAENDTATAAYALMQMEEVIDDEEEAIEVLNHLLDSNTTKSVKNLIKMKLAEIYLWSDQREEATELLMSLIKN